ncbi:unnamed protein product, partial [Gordionus sp. m RMFG-2023]
FHYENGKYPLEEDKILAREHIFATWKQLQAIDPHEENTTLRRNSHPHPAHGARQFFWSPIMWRDQNVPVCISRDGELDSRDTPLLIRYYTQL